MDKTLRIVVILTLVVWFFVGVMVLGFVLLAKSQGQGFVCQFFEKCCPKEEIQVPRAPLAPPSEARDPFQAPGVDVGPLGGSQLPAPGRQLLTDEVRECVAEKLEIDTDEIIKPGQGPSQETMTALRECLRDLNAGE